MAEPRYLQQGELEAFTANPPQAEDLQWVNPPGDGKINGVIIPLGYTQQQLQNPEFQARYKEITDRFFSDYSPEHFNLTLYTGKEPDVGIATFDKKYLEFIATQIYSVKRTLSAVGSTKLDNVHFMINPDALNKFHGQQREDKNFFGYADITHTVIAGPYEKEGHWKLADSVILAHEMGHALTRQLVSCYDPVFITDYYTRSELHDSVTFQGRAEAQLLNKTAFPNIF